MKTNKLLVAGLATTIALGLTVSSSFAYGGGMGKGNGMGQGYGMNQTNERMGNGGSTGNMTNLISNFEKSDLSESEAERLAYQYSEEMLARDIYEYFYELYGLQTFQNIANSEIKHMDAVKSLLDRYSLDIPSGYGELEDEYNALKTEGEKGLKEALEVGVKIEILDIEDMVKSIKSTDNNDIKAVYLNIGGASYNHLRGFLTGLNNAGYETDIDYSSYLNDSELSTKGGALKSKLAEKLETEGVELPDVDLACDNEGGQHAGNNRLQGQQRINNNSVIKNEYTVKYGTIISKMSDDKLNVLVEKIDLLLEKINSGNYSTATKQKFNPILLTLKDLALENLDSNEIDIDGLFDN